MEQNEVSAASQAEAAEEWRPVFGFELAYSVSNFGRVRTEPRVVTHAARRPNKIPARMLKLPPNRYGYPEVHLHFGGKSKTWLVHQLVLYAFVGPRPAGFVCRHLDGNPGNARLDNLTWGTQRENLADAVKHGVIARGSDVHGARLTAEQVLSIRADTRSQSHIAAEYCVDQSHISRIKSRDVWAHL